MPAHWSYALLILFFALVLDVFDEHDKAKRTWKTALRSYFCVGLLSFVAIGVSELLHRAFP